MTSAVLVAERYADLMVMRTFDVNIPHWVNQKWIYKRNYCEGLHCLVIILGHLLVMEKEKLIEICMELHNNGKWQPLPNMTLYVRGTNRPGIVLQTYNHSMDSLERFALELNRA